jgi:hypothetical protein
MIMRTKAPGLAVWTLATALARMAAAQEPGPPPDEPPPGDEPPVEVVPGPPGQPPPGGPSPSALPPAEAPQQDADLGFGFAGQITISDDVQLTAVQVSFDSQGRTTKRTQIQLQPALDFFPIANLSVGGQLIFGYASFETNGTSTHQTELGLLGRIGYTFAIGATTSIWPRLSLGYDRPIGQTPAVAGSNAQSFALQVYVPIVFQPVPHFFIGGGPIVSREIISKMNDVDAPKETTIGLQSTLGGYFRGM